MKRLLSLVLLASAAFATQQSITITAGGTFAPGMASTYGAPFASFTSSFRMETRIDAVPTGVTSSAMCMATICVTAQANFSISTTNVPEALVGGQNNLGISTPTLDVNALLVTRVQRFAGVKYTLEAWELYPTFQYWSTSVAILTANNDWSTTSSYFDFGTPGNSVAWAEWFTGTVTPGQGSTYCTASPAAPCIPDITDSNPGTFGSWEFEGTGATVLLDGSAGHLGNLGAGGATYTTAATPTYNPLCNPGPTQVFVAGGSGSQTGFGLPLDGVTPSATLLWTKLTGPLVTMTGTSTGTLGLSNISNTMVLRGLTPSVAAYTFQLSVTDASLNNSTCSVKAGAVNVDANDLVITGNATIDALVHRQMRWSSPNNPWPWLDTQNKSMEDGMLSHVYGLGVNPTCTSTDPTVCRFQPYWLNFQAGTISIPAAPDAGSSTVTGVGTNFLSVLGCSMGSPPPGAGALISVEYLGTGGNLNGTSAGLGPNRLHYISFIVNTCTDATHLAINTSEGGSSSNVGWAGWMGTPTGRWAVDIGAAAYSQWAFGEAPGNFYNSLDMAPLQLYIRTGIDDYYQAFITGATNFLQDPYIDLWACFAGSKLNGGPAQRLLGQGFNSSGEWSEQGGFILALLEGDKPCTDSGCTTGTGLFPPFRNLYDFTVHAKLNFYTGFIGDRIDGHDLAILSFCAHYDPHFVDSYYGLTCSQLLDGIFANIPYAADPITGGLYSGNSGENTNNLARATTDARSSYAFNSVRTSITGATNASPIVITASNGFADGDSIFISGVAGNTAANGTWTISSTSSTQFSLVGSTGNGTYTAATGSVVRAWCVSGDCSGTSVTLTKGSTAIVCNDGSGGTGATGACNWEPGTYGNGTFLWVQNTGYSPTIPASWTFPGSTTITTAQSPYTVGGPAGYATGDQVNYVIASITDQHHATLAVPYQGTNGNHLYQLAYGLGGPSGLNGFYTQPYMAGVVGDGLWRVYQDLTAAGDTATAAIVANVLTKQANFLLNYVIDPARKGPTYFVNSLNCWPYTSIGGAFPHDGNCDVNTQDDAGARTLFAEASMGVQGYMLYAGASAPAAFRTWLINGLNAAWAKPGTCGNSPLCKPDGSYINGLDVNGFMSTWGSSDIPWKWNGQFFGSSMAPSILAILQQTATAGATNTGGHRTGVIHP